MPRQGVGVDVLAEECGVDPKTVERWIYGGRIPHRRHRWAAAGLLRADETYLWPDVAVANTDQPAQRELLALYPDGASVPHQIRLGLLAQAQEHIDVLVFSGTFFAQTMPRVGRVVSGRRWWGRWPGRCCRSMTSSSS